MRFSHFFIERPIFAAVLSVLLTIAGAVAQRSLPVSEYPEIAPPTVNISTFYPGASAEVVAATVATPIEQQVNGVDDMLYITSQSTGDGKISIDVVFKPGTDVDKAQVLVQNRVAIATPRLPQEVIRQGVTVQKASPDLMMVVHMISPDGSRDQKYISNYATLYIKDALSRVDGVGNVQILGARDYSMRVWLDPGKIAARGLTAGEVVAALQAANLQVAAGAINQPPAKSPGAFQLSVQTLGRLIDPEQFGDIVIRADGDGYIRVRDVARVELGALDYTVNTYLDRDAATAMLIFQRPGSNALATAAGVKAVMAEAKKDFPPGVDYTIAYNPTEFIQQSVDEVVHTLFEAVGLVVLVVIVFLQTWRAAIIPVIAIPVSLIGCFLDHERRRTDVQHAVPVRARAGDRHRRRRRDRRCRKCGALPRTRHEPEGSGSQDDGRSRRCPAGNCHGAVRRVYPGSLHYRTTGRLLQAIRDHDRQRHGDFCLCVADLVAGAGRHLTEAAPDRAERIEHDAAAFCFRCAGSSPDSTGSSTGSASAYGALTARLIRVGFISLVVYAGLIYLRRRSDEENADRPDPAARPRLSDCGFSAAAGRVARPHRQGAARSERDHPESQGS